jgi:hypothetical protein
MQHLILAAQTAWQRQMQWARLLVALRALAAAQGLLLLVHWAVVW